MLSLRNVRSSSYCVKQFLRFISNEPQPNDAETQEDQSDLFGTLSRTGKKTLAVQVAEKLIPDDPDGYDKEEFSLEPRKNAYYYKYEVAKYAKQGPVGLRKALELFDEMKSVARLEPTLDQFTPLIYGCAKAGFTKRAFELFNESIKYNSGPTRAMLTCLINACAESPFPEYGLKRLDWLMNHVRINYSNVNFNLIHYNCAIKAYGKMGRLDQAARLIQTMLDKDIYPDEKTFSMLLMGCATHKEAGTTIALRIIKRLKMYDLKMDTHLYNLFLRCIRDCGLGDKDLLRKTYEELPALMTIDERIAERARRNARGGKKGQFDEFVWIPILQDLGKSIEEAVSDGKTTQALPGEAESKKEKNSDSALLTFSNNETGSLALLTSDNGNLPNLLSDDHLSLMMRIKAIQFDKLSHEHSRIMLFGGVDGFLETMLKDGCKPDVKTLTLLLDLQSPSRDKYLKFFSLTDTFKIQRDLLFYDQLIRHVTKNWRSVKGALEMCLNFIEEMHLDNLRPNISTYEALAAGCRSWRKASRLIGDLERSGFRVSDRMIREFFYAAIDGRDVNCLNNLISLANARGFKPSRILVDKLENFRLFYDNVLLNHERGTPRPEQSHWIITSFDVKLYDEFKAKLSSWLSRAQILEEEHPWSQYDVKSTSKREGFVRFERHMRAMNEAKYQALKRGHGLGNISSIAEKMVEARGQSVSQAKAKPTSSALTKK